MDDIYEGKKWYVLRVVSGKERKLKEYIEQEISRSGWENMLPQVLVPTEKVYQPKNGKKAFKEKNLYPGYIFILAEEGRVDANVIAALRGISGVIGFLGKENPEPLHDDEARRMLRRVDDLQEADEKLIEPFIINETVKIIDGPFNDFQGTIEEINEDKKKMKVVVKIFGRRTPVEVGFMQVEKIS
ncbi:MAG: transcription termination/antitermination factor NusG [Bacteroidetes bacterium]|nr:transcription termination/antitermination factor NusG [Bacteroidota bacterium]MCB9042453.1 transcription termination/antitermination factor NusG [Chitinophagales bacterium]